MKYKQTYNADEKNHTKKISQQFFNLKNSMPFLKNNKKISKIDILKNANKTISNLEKLYIENISQNAKLQNIKNLNTWCNQQLHNLRSCFSKICKNNKMRIKKEEAYFTKKIKKIKKKKNSSSKENIRQLDEYNNVFLKNVDNKSVHGTNKKLLCPLRLSENCQNNSNINLPETPITSNILKSKNETVIRKPKPESHFAKSRNYNCCNKLDFQLDDNINEVKSNVRIMDKDLNIEDKYDFSVIDFSDEDPDECFSYAAKIKSIHGQSPLFSQTSYNYKILSPKLKCSFPTSLHFNLDGVLSDEDRTNIKDDVHLDINIKDDVHIDINIKDDVHLDINMKDEINLDINIKDDVNLDNNIKDDVNLDINVKDDVYLDNNISNNYQDYSPLHFKF